MMRILGTGFPLPLWRRAFRKELREEGAPAPKALSPKPERSAEEKVKGKGSRSNAADEPPRTWCVPCTVGGESNLPWFVTPL